MRAIVVCFPPVYPPHPKSRNKLRSVALFPAYPRPSLSQRLRSKALRLISRYLNGCYQAPRLLAASVYQTAAGRHRLAAKKCLNAANAEGFVRPFRGTQNRQKQAEARQEVTPQPLRQTLFCGKSDK